MVLTLLGYFLCPLTLEEVAAAVMLPEPRDVLRICPSSMVTTVQFDGYNLDGSSRKDFVRFDHFSVKEYLSAIPSTSSGTAYSFVPPEIAHLTIAQGCVSR